VKRRGGDAAALVAEASSVGLAILAAPDDVPWRRLDALLMSVLGARGTGADPGPGVGEELFALANAIAAVTGGSVAIEDLDRQVLAYSSVQGQRIDVLRQEGILARRVPEMSRNLWQYRQVLAADHVVRFEEVADEMARSAITIRAGSQPLGTIWAIERPGGLPPGGQDVLLDGARLAAVHLLRARDAGELDLHARDGALRGALDGSWTAHEVAFRLSLPTGAELALVGFAPAPDLDGSAPFVTQIGTVLTRYFAAYRPDAAVATTSRTVFVLLPTGGAATAHRLATGALNALGKDFGKQLRAAAAYTSTDPTELPRMRTEIEDVLAITTTQQGLPTFARLADVHARVVLTRVAEVLAQQPRLRHPGIDAMATYDRDHHTDYAPSVTAWLDAVGDITTAARQLRVHPNTLRYRLKRANELFGLHLDRPDERLSAWMQLRLLR
jgi:DNA-binding PucR family transcriptional regulator